MSTPIHWENPTPQDEARLATALLAGTPIERCAGKKTGKGAVEEQCRKIARWRVEKQRFVPAGQVAQGGPYQTYSSYTSCVERISYCRRHVPMVGTVSDIITGAKVAYPWRESMRRIASETPDRR